MKISQYVSLGGRAHRAQCLPISLSKSSAIQKVGGLSLCYKDVKLTLLPHTVIPRYEGRCSGTVSCFALSNAPLKVIWGKVEFFAQQGASAKSKVISYSLVLLSIEGEEFSLQGNKYIDSNIFFSVSATWKATTTVNVSITRKNGPQIGSGRLHISLPQFARQIRTFRPTLDFRLTLLLSLLAFVSSFAYNISVFFFRPFGPAQFPSPTNEKPADSGRRPSRVSKIKTEDNVEVLLKIFEPQSLSDDGTSYDDSKLPPVLCLPGVTGVGAEHHLFALPYLRCNMVDYLTARGHRCYALTPRWGCEAAVAEECTVFDCRLDIAAALAYVCNREAQKPYVVAHCQGSVALSMGLLDGTIPSNEILGITANSVFMNEVFAYWNALKGRTTLLISLYERLAGKFFPIHSSRSDSAFQRILDILLRFYPVGRRDICTSTTCHRTSFGFGLLWNHENLDHNTHDNIHRFFAGTHTKLLKHVVRMGTYGMCLDNKLRPLLTSENLERLRSVPILFISGTDNEVFKPESTLRDYEMLRRRFGEENYRRFLPEGYGHLDPIVGKSSAEDVYWRVFEHLQSCSKRYGAGKISQEVDRLG